MVSKVRGAAIDLGSNSFICYVFESINGELKTLDDQIILTRLSEGVEQTKTISSEALGRAEKAFESFQKLFKKYNVTKIKAVATSAARDASNQKAFINLASKYQIPVQIISGEEEALITFNGVQDYFKNDDGLIIDIGGGSTEFIYVKNCQILDRVSLDIGVVRFTERYLGSKEFKAQESIIREALKKELLNNNLLNEFKNQKFSLFLAVSGTPTTAVSILKNQFDPSQIDGSNLDQQSLSFILDHYGYLNLDDRLEKYPFVEEKRADVLPTGILILDEALKFFEFKAGYKVSTRGIRHGLARFMCSTHRN